MIKINLKDIKINKQKMKAGFQDFNCMIMFIINKFTKILIEKMKKKIKTK